VEASGPVPGLIESARANSGEVDPNLVLVEPGALAAVLGRETARETFTLLSYRSARRWLFPGRARDPRHPLYDVSRYRDEIGVRMGLGSGTAEMRWMVTRRGQTLTAMEVAAATLIALASAAFSSLAGRPQCAARTS
jgi:hypothetical protein